MPFEIISEGWPLLALTGILGLIIGSFLNVVIYRTPLVLDRQWKSECREYLEIEAPKEDASQNHFSVVWPGSSCTHCKTPIKAWENIPVLSYLLLKGKCSACQTPISIRYPLVEIITALLTILVALKFGLTWAGLGAMLLTWSLITLTGIDFDTQLLPDGICLPLMWLGLIANSFGTYTDINSALWGAICGYMVLWSVFWVFKFVTGKDGMGFGDFKLLAALGAWMGWQFLPMIILISSITGLTAAILMMIFLSHDRRVPIAFGPYLAIGGWLSFLYGPEMASTIPFLSVF